MRSWVAVCAFFVCTSSALAQVEIKIATLAPHGSSWANIMEKGNARLQAETRGRVKLRTYYSGQQGDERDVVRKMKLGQLDGAALTAVGLGLIVPDVLVLQLPYLFTSDQQVDRVRDELGPDFEKAFDAAGYVLLSWGDVGWVHMYMTEALDSPEKLAAAKMWQLVDDPISRAYFELLGLNGVPLGVGDVLLALQTGSIQACFGPPLAAIALQWHTKVKFMTDRPSNYAIGAFVVRKEAFARLTAEDQKLMRAGSREMGTALIASVRRDNQRAMKAMIKAGIITVHVPDEAQAQLVAAAKVVWRRLAGKVYSKEILDRVLEVVSRVITNMKQP